MTEYQPIFEKVKKASRKLVGITDSKINEILEDLAVLAKAERNFLISENQKDLAQMESQNPMYDRLLLSVDRIIGISEEILQVSRMASPLHHVLENKVLENGLSLKKITVPLGVIGIIYEARPNVTFDVFSLALKSGNGCQIFQYGNSQIDSFGFGKASNSNRRISIVTC
jgi:glutamate-5-semialdehyde dehydrogenase